MGFSILISVLLVTVSAISLNKNSMMTQLFKDPHAFAATFQNADPEQIKAVIAMIDGLIDEGQAEKDTAIDNYETANQTWYDAIADHDEAEAADWHALGQRDTSQLKVNSWENKVSVAAAAEADAELFQNSASDDQISAQADFDAGQLTHDKEQEALLGAKEVVAQMINPAEGRRRLLAMVKIDPAALDNVNGIIDDLIAKSTQTLAEYASAFKDAKDAHDIAQQSYSAAVTEHVTLQGELEEHRKDLVSKLARVTETDEALQAAKIALEEADSAQQAADTIRQNETTRVDEENGTLTQVRGMLVSLLPGGVE